MLAPSNLDLTPLNLRKAKVSWLKPRNNLPNTKYEVTIKPLGSTDLSKVHREVASDNNITIALDNVLPSLTDLVGLQEPPYAYEVYVKALSTGTGISDTGFAEQLIMIDTPITQADGKSKLAYGMATLAWNAVDSPEVLGSAYANGNYHFRYRRMGGQLDSNYWDPTIYLNDLPTGYVGNKTSHVIPFLNLNDIYAIQLKYDLITPTRTTRVYSARDVYVWAAPPSDAEHGNQFPEDRLASYQFFGHWPDRQFHYTICENTFDPTADQTPWTQMINHAYANWQATSAKLITVHPNTATCEFPVPVLAGLFNIDTPGDYSPDDTSFGMVMSTFNRTNQIYMVNVADWRDNPVEYAKVTLNEVFLCIFSAPACVISSDYYNTERSANLKLDRSRFTLKMQPGSVDMLINREKLGRTSRPNFDPRNVPGINQVYDDDDIPFNTCLNRDGSRVSNLNTDDAGTFFPYKTVVHEVGHTLGLSGYQLRKVIEDLTTSQQEASYVMSHPTIPDSTMNYDSRVRRNHVSGIVRFEPDCSPHPFDLMALYALYQTVKR